MNTLHDDTAAAREAMVDELRVDRARACLDTAGYRRVRTVVADAEGGVGAHAPYDLVIVTTRSWDIPPAWIAQLTGDGRIVVPLRMGGLQVDAAALTRAVHQPRVELWSGVEFDRVDDLDLWLGTWLPGYGILTAEHSVLDEGVLTAATRRGVPAAVSPGGFAYRTKRAIPDTDGFETGVLAWEPDATGLGEQYVEAIRRWGRYRADGGAGPRVDIQAADSVDGTPAGRVINKIHTRVVLSWP